MKNRPFALCWLFILMAGACADRDRSLDPAPKADPCLTLSTPRIEYLLGEPVLLNLILRNTSPEPVNVVECMVWPNHYEAKPWIAAGGLPFQEFSPNNAIQNVTRRVSNLAPEDYLTYKYRVVGGRTTGEFRLAFAEPGDYRVYVRYPLWRAEAAATVEIASNVVQVHIKKPVGDNAKIWQQLNDPAFLTLLQTETVDKRNKNLVLKMGEILHENPGIGYAPALRHTLSVIYFHHDNRSSSGMTQQELAQIATTLGITEIDCFKDKRLGARRDLPFDDSKLSREEIRKKLGEKTPVSEILRTLSKSSGVKLNASDAVNSKKSDFREIDLSVRDRMHSLACELESYWERRGDGYFLVPFDAEKTPKAENAKREKK